MSARMRALLCAGACAALSGCGATTKPSTPLRLQLTSPADGADVTSTSVLVSGTVTPTTAANVFVLGQSVAVSHGAFTARVQLQPGTNIIDVLAGAPHAVAAMAAVRVYRQVEVTIPALAGQSPSAATRALRGAGLVPRIQNDSQLFDFLLPNPPLVCNSTPPAGRSVPPGTAVTLSVSKTC
jgi:hypothetical protein